ncbi:MAG: beta-galactosidase [Ignavibacteriae bacterium HGW-Ignavibacteriae-3]|nr:MAG: beta-galactosidase [Ignavibacteriae bacterium HGW-Ignavibacteriae-3]
MKRFFFLIIVSAGIGFAQTKHTFSLSPDNFLLDEKPFQIISGEIHPARVPAEYWRHRIQMAKAMGCNTIGAYIFWNYHESSPGKFDFKTGNKNLTKFFQIAQEEGMWVLLRPGPYVCAEWDFGGLPPYLLKIPDIKVRCMDPRYMEAAERYLVELSKIIKPLLITNGGPILMVQIENEYGSYGNDKSYLEELRKIWIRNGIDVPFFTGDGPTPYMLEAGNIEGAAIGLDSGSNENDFAQAKKANPAVPSFSSETYPGWLTHWGEKWARPDTAGLMKEVKFLMDNKKSFNFYVIHGGTNFGFSAGANSGGKGYEPDLTSYDYDAPINEQGSPAPKYFALRNLISKYSGNLPDVPEPVKSIEIPEIKMELFSSVWNNLPAPVHAVQPKPMEMFNQYEGFILYRTKLIGHKSGKLLITNLHDYALIFLNGIYVEKLDRREAENIIALPKSDVKDPVLEIFVEAMGRINFAQQLIDRKGITERVTLNGMTLMNWEVFNMPFGTDYIRSISQSSPSKDRRGFFFKALFELEETGDTFIDMSNYRKGVVFVNGNNLGRYWEIGPQKRLYCPAPWLKKGTNEIVVFDLHETEPKSISGKKVLED